MFRKVFAGWLLIMSFVWGDERPQLWVYTGPEACPWSNLFMTEVWAELKETLSSEIQLTHIPFSKECQVEVFPSLILLSEGGEKWADIPFIPLGAKEYAEKIREMLHLGQALKRISLSVCDEIELQRLYHQARDFGFFKDASRILEEGLKKEKGLFFLLEKYALSREVKKRGDPELVQMRKYIRKRDPNDQNGAIFQLALLDFEHLEKKKKEPLKVVAPLLEYIQTIQKKNKDNVWRAEVLIARYFLNKNMHEEALYHAQNSLAASPPEMKAYITGSFSNLLH
jgi:hypothetical protein